MRLNFKQHYGHVYGHPVATYTQDNKMFDGGGNEVTDDGEVAREESNEEAKEFLLTLLSGTKMAKTKIVKEADSQGVSWHLVEDAANEMNVVKFKEKNAWVWRLSEEV